MPRKTRPGHPTAGTGIGIVCPDEANAQSVFSSVEKAQDYLKTMVARLGQNKPTR